MDQIISAQVSQIIGLGGVFIYLLSYALLQMGIIGGNSYAYPGMKVIAACMVMVSLVHAFNLTTLLIQISFIVISLYGMIRLAVLTHTARFSEEDAKFLRQKLPFLAPHLARKLLNAGSWVDIEADTELATEGTPLEHLIYLAKGEVKVFVKGAPIGTRSNATFIGELTCLDNLPATATIKTSGRSRCLKISAERLRHLTKKHFEIRVALLASFSQNTKETLLIQTKEIIEMKLQADKIP